MDITLPAYMFCSVFYCEDFMKDYLTVKEIAEKWGVSVRWVQTLCNDGKIEGTVKFGKAWAIPADVEKPMDGRVTTGEYRDWRKK